MDYSKVDLLNPKRSDDSPLIDVNDVFDDYTMVWARVGEIDDFEWEAFAVFVHREPDDHHLRVLKFSGDAALGIGKALKRKEAFNVYKFGSHEIEVLHKDLHPIIDFEVAAELAARVAFRGGTRVTYRWEFIEIKPPELLDKPVVLEEYTHTIKRGLFGASRRMDEPEPAAFTFHTTLQDPDKLRQLMRAQEGCGGGLFERHRHEIALWNHSTARDHIKVWTAWADEDNTVWTRWGRDTSSLVIRKASEHQSRDSAVAAVYELANNKQSGGYYPLYTTMD